jgi:hypothetical protein
MVVDGQGENLKKQNVKNGTCEKIVPTDDAPHCCMRFLSVCWCKARGQPGITIGGCDVGLRPLDLSRSMGRRQPKTKQRMEGVG